MFEDFRAKPAPGRTLGGDSRPAAARERHGRRFARVERELVAKVSLRRRSAAEESLELDPAADPFAPESVRHLAARFGSPLFVIDAERVRLQYRRLAAALPGVDLHYALKPLPHASVIATLRDEGAFFDLATNGEVDLVRRVGVAPERCIHTHPIKRDGDIRTA